MDLKLSSKRFGPDRRVRKRPEFLDIQSNGRRTSTKNFILIVALASESSSLPRLGITASKRVGNAVRRNRLKRIVRAAFRQLPELLPPGIDLVVICKSGPADLSSDQVVEQWKGAQKWLSKSIAQLKVVP